GEPTMLRTPLPWVLALAFLSAATAGPAQEPAGATIVVTVPADAVVTFDGTATRQTGPRRVYHTPPLDPRTDYSYEFRAEVVRDGGAQARTAKVIVRAGATTPVDLSDLGAGAETAPAVGTWPRRFATDGAVVTVFPPRFESWENDRLAARAVVAVET